MVMNCVSRSSRPAGEDRVPAARLGQHVPLTQRRQGEHQGQQLIELGFRGSCSSGLRQLGCCQMGLFIWVMVIFGARRSHLGCHMGCVHLGNGYLGHTSQSPELLSSGSWSSWVTLISVTLIRFKYQLDCVIVIRGTVHCCLGHGQWSSGVMVIWLSHLSYAHQSHDHLSAGHRCHLGHCQSSLGFLGLVHVSLGHLGLAPSEMLL